MNYPLKSELMYMMPTHFGPMAGPRQGPGGRKFMFAQDQRKTMTVSVSFTTNAEQLQSFLPPGFELRGDPVVTVFETFMKEIAWLAGRGYNVLGVTIPVTFSGVQDRAEGPFLLVLWENLTDPILTGREQLGFSKIYCELPEPVVYNGETHCTASWLGFRFLDIKLFNMTAVAAEDLPTPTKPNNDGVHHGTLHYKYVPKTGQWGEADTTYVTLSPEPADRPQPKALLRGEGTVTFHPARWEDLPTQYMIVNAFHELEIREYNGAMIEHRVGGGDLNNQRIVR